MQEYKKNAGNKKICRSSDFLQVSFVNAGFARNHCQFASLIADLRSLAREYRSLLTELVKKDDGNAAVFMQAIDRVDGVLEMVEEER